MRKNLLILIFLQCNFYSLFAQTIIYPIWNRYLKDTTTNKADWNRGIPRYVFQDKNYNTFVVSTSINGWSVQKINLQTGEIIWSNGQNQNFPDNTTRNFLLEKAFFNDNGTIEVIGRKDWSKYPKIYAGGYAVKVIYDIKTGKELSRAMKSDNAKDFVALQGGVGKAFVKKEKGYLNFEISPENPGNLWIRSLDSTMTLKDTISEFNMVLQPQFNLSHLSTNISEAKNNSILCFTYLLGGVGGDSTKYKHIYRNFDRNGKLLFAKDLAKDLFYTIGYNDYQPVKDGFIISGYTDTLYISKNGKEKKWFGIAAKFDYLGNRKWITILPDTINNFYRAVFTSEDIKRNGHWAFVGANYFPKSYSELFFISNEGKAKKIAKIVIPNDTERYQPRGAWSLENGDLLLSLMEQKCETSVSPHCSKLALINKKSLDDALLSNEDIVTEKIIDFMLFPNPSSYNTNLQFSENQSGQISVYNLSGQKLYQQNFKDCSQCEVNTNNLSNGIYFATILLDNGFEGQQKLVIQK